MHKNEINKNPFLLDEKLQPAMFSLLFFSPAATGYPFTSRILVLANDVADARKAGYLEDEDPVGIHGAFPEDPTMIPSDPTNA
ncbi:hypothetical protein Trydic_g5881 [Trypoxylus dichotomus]